VLTGCGKDAPPPPEPVQSAAEGQSTAFDEATAGVVRGQFVWQGEPPHVPPYLAPVNPLSESAPGRGLHEWPNVCAPVIDTSGGICHAVVFLRGVDPRKAKPWDLPPVRVELEDYQVHVRQGDAVGRCGIVRSGTQVGFVSKQPVFHSLQARGAAWFALPFADANCEQTRTLSRPGVVELCSGAGYYWMRGYLFVLEHPYAAETDASGSFTLRGVPPGRYELVVWHPNWQEASHSRDADTCQICRLVLRPPFEAVQAVDLGPRETRAVTVTLPSPRRP
jgi:hypothetical protein